MPQCIPPEIVKLDACVAPQPLPPAKIDPQRCLPSGGHFFNFPFLLSNSLRLIRRVVPGLCIRRNLWSKRTGIFMQKSSHQPKEGYFLEIDGKFESEYATFTRALKAGFELWQKFPQSQVKVHGANEQTPAVEKSD